MKNCSAKAVIAGQQTSNNYSQFKQADITVMSYSNALNKKDRMQTLKSGPKLGFF